MPNNNNSSIKIYALSMVHIFRILIMIFFAICPILFTFISIYCIFKSEWTKSFIYAIIGGACYFTYSTICDWFEDARIKFKKEVDDWSASLEENKK